MDVTAHIESFFESEGIASYGTIPFSSCRITNERALIRLFGERMPKKVIMAAVPYLVKRLPKNISAYAFSRDYHLYFKKLYTKMRAYLDNMGAECEFVISGDNSPIDERFAAMECGIGFVGRNGLLINEIYGTYFFLCGIYFFDDIPSVSKNTTKRKTCLECGRCISSCPTGTLLSMDYEKCLSAITQKKSISEEEEETIKKNGSVWGCDVCQEVCPHNRNALETEIDFFKNDTVSFLDDAILDDMLKTDAFSERAFAWRGERVVRRNIDIINVRK
ncbi:MAG: epoxyqueuosine reductase [Ruminococcaceae bacterium]|nr:epoxyqueuosine reductase [Oscillospiraceae bacterium]